MDPTETADPTQRRRVRPVDETAVAVHRAQLSLAEIAQREAADAAREASDAAARDAAESARRAERTDWSAGAGPDGDADGVVDDVPVLSRDE